MEQRIDAFLAHMQVERGLSPNSVSAYHNDLLQFVRFMEAEALRAGNGSVPLSSVDREHLAGFLLDLHQRGYAPATIARKVAALKSFFHYLRRAGEVAADPTDGLGAPEVKKTAPHGISAADVEILFNHAQMRDTLEAFRDVAMLRTLYATGMRVSELVTLDLADLSLDDATVRAVGRGGRERTLPLQVQVVTALRAYLEEARPTMVRPHRGEVALFLNHRGLRLTRQGFWLIMKGLVQDCGISVQATPHTLRHSFAAHRLRDGVALQQLQQLLGHASISTTQIYTLKATPVRKGVRPGHSVAPNRLASLRAVGHGASEKAVSMVR